MSAHKHPNYLPIQLGAKSKKKSCPTKRSAHHNFLDKTMRDILYFFPKSKCVSVVTCKVRKAISIEGSFNKINKFIFQ